MKLCTFCTPSHEALLNDWFLPSAGNEYEVEIHNFDQECPTGNIHSEGWIKSLSHKFEILIESTKENWGEVFVHSDVDIQFFGQTRDYILNRIEGEDILFQREEPKGTVCMGFFACVGNERTLNFWMAAKKIIEESIKLKDAKMNDQRIVNNMLRTFSLLDRFSLRPNKRQDRSNIKNDFGIRWDYLPDEFFGAGNFTGQIWNPGMQLNVPENILMHHANFTIGVTNKIAQLSYVKKIVEGRKVASCIA